MINIQVIFLFTSQRSFSYEERDLIKSLVKSKYAQHFGVREDTVDITLQDGASLSNLNDIVLAIETDKRVINEGIRRGKMRDDIARELLRYQFMKNCGFSGKIGLKDGLIKTREKRGYDESEFTENSPTETRKKHEMNSDNTSDKLDYVQRAQQYVAVEPKYSFGMLKIPEDTRDQIFRALNRIRFEREIFQEWGLYAIMPNPVCALSFYGAPGTGKSMAAEAIAEYLKKKIIKASYADIENKYVGEGPKNVSAIFLAAEQQDAVLFIDEADSLLSKRMVNVSEPSGQAMNSMRSQLLICLENYHGIVIFATNLAVNYDRAFISRLINVEFTLPDAKMREEIWRSHLYASPGSKVELKIPLASDVDLKELAEKYEFAGRNIRNCVVEACVLAHERKQDTLTQACLIEAADSIMQQIERMEKATDTTGKSASLTREQKKILAQSITQKKEEMRQEGKEPVSISALDLE